MRKLLFIVLLVSSIVEAQAQQNIPVQASIGLGSSGNRVKIYIRPSASFAAANISTLQFNIGILSSISPKPVATVLSTTLASAPLSTWRIDTITEGGYTNYNMVTSAGSILLDAIANTEIEIMEVQFSNGPVSPNNVSLVTLPNGGMNSNTLFLSTGDLKSVGSNLYYARAGVSIDNKYSYDENLVNPGVATSTATLGGVVLPVSWLNFNAVRNINDVRVTWDVANEINVDRYELEVSTNGTDFVKFATVPKSANNNPSYSHLDVQVARYSAKQLHYRIKQVDKDGKFSYSPTKTVRLDVKGETALYPNPAKDGFTLTIPFLNANQKRIQLQLVNGLGQVVERKDITRLAAANYYFSLNSSLVTSGEYMLKIFEDGELMETKKVSVKR